MVRYPKRTIYRRRFWIKARNIPNDFKLRPVVRENLNEFSWFIYTDIYTIQDDRVILIKRRVFVTPELWRDVVILENGANPNRRTERNSRSPDKCTWTWWSAFRVQSIERRHKRATIVPGSVYRDQWDSDQSNRRNLRVSYLFEGSKLCVRGVELLVKMRACAESNETFEPRGQREFSYCECFSNWQNPDIPSTRNKFHWFIVERILWKVEEFRLRH